MRLPFSFSFKRKKPAEYILSIIIRDTSISAVVFETESNLISVFSRIHKSLDKSISEVSHEALLDICDKVVSLAEQNLPQESILKKTIFSLPGNWVIEGKIKREFVGELKKICEELSLEPIGFIVLTEAVLFALQKQEGAPVSAVVVEVGSVTCSISLSRAGRIVENKTVNIDKSIPFTVESALKGFTNIEIFPARIVVFDGEHKESLRHLFLRHSWDRSLPFLHVPQVNVLPKSFDIHSVLLGTATQLDLVVKNEDYLQDKKPEEVLPVAEEEELVDKNIKEDKKDVINNKSENQNNIDTLNKNEPEQNEEFKEVVLEQESKEQESDLFGFSVNKDVAQAAQVSQVFAEIPEKVKEEITHENKKDSLTVESTLLFKSVFMGIRKFFKKLSRKKNNSDNSKSNSKLIFIGIFIIILLIGLIFGYIYILHANIILNLKSEEIQASQPVVLAVSKPTDIVNKTIGVKIVQVDENSSVSQEATGTKDIGSPAKGQVTIFSRLTDTNIFPKGTVFIASNGLKFSLDTSVNIASFSGGPDDPSVTTSNVTLTASSIGPEYNFPIGTKFTISGQSKSDVSAKNDTPFSGGAKSTITVVSQKDIDGLSSSLIKNLENSAKADLQKKLDSGFSLIDGFIKEDISQKKLDNNVGDKAKSVTLNAVVTYQVLSFSKDDVYSFANGIIKSSLPSGMEIINNKISVIFSDVKKKDDSNFQANVSLKSAYIPKINTSFLQKQIAGKSYNQAEAIIKNIPQVTDVKIVETPLIPFLPHILPRIASNISISLQE